MTMLQMEPTQTPLERFVADYPVIDNRLKDSPAVFLKVTEGSDGEPIISGHGLTSIRAYDSEYDWRKVKIPLGSFLLRTTPDIMGKVPASEAGIAWISLLNDAIRTGMVLLDVIVRATHSVSGYAEDDGDDGMTALFYFDPYNDKQIPLVMKLLGYKLAKR